MKESKQHNPFVEIFKDFWSNFTAKHTSYATDYYHECVKKMIDCGDPKFGYIEYGCMQCGKYLHRIGFTCKNSLCLRCGRVRSEDFVSQVMVKLHPGIIYRHLVLTLPDQLKPLFYKNRHSSDLYNELYKIGYEYIQDVFQTVTGKHLKCGAIVVLHTSGRKGNYRPHLHIVVMNGGLDVGTGRWVNIGYFPYGKIMPRKWQWYVLNMVKSFDNSAKNQKLVDKLWKQYPKGFVNCFKKGEVPKRSNKLVGYLAKYLFRPSISIKRIIKYNKSKKTVKYSYADHRTGKTQTEEVGVLTFIGRTVQQLLPKGFHRVKYYGLHYPRTFVKSRNLIIAAMKKINIDIIPAAQAVFKVMKKTYQERLKLWTGRDPLVCPHCHAKLELVKVWVKGKGSVFDLLEELKKTGPPPKELLDLQSVTPTSPLAVVESFFEQLDIFTSTY